MTSSTPQTDPARTMTAEVVIDAPAEQVWAALTDFRTLAEASPELVRMIPIGRGGLREGQRYVGINKRKFVFWPTLNRVDVVDPPHRISWMTTTSGTHWSYTLTPEGTGTRVSETRAMESPLTGFNAFFAKALLGGVGGHADELEEGMTATLAHLKKTLEK